MDPHPPMLDVVLEDQALAVLAAVDDLRLAPVEAVHDARVALRRLRSSLKGFRPLLDSPGLADLLDDLKWLAGELSDARDVQVATQRVLAALEWVPAGPAEKPLLEVFEDAAAFATLRATTALTDPRMAELQGRLQGLLVGRNDRGAYPDAVQDRVAGTLGDLLGRLAELEDRAPAELHAVRKLAKRARAMLAAVMDNHEVLPARSGARRVVRRLGELQDRLGEYQDAVTTAGLLRQLAPQIGSAAPLAERLAVHEDAEAGALRSGFPEAADALRQACRRLERRTGLALS